MNTLKKLIEDNPITATNLAKVLGLTRAGFYEIINSNRGFTQQQIELIEDAIRAWGVRLMSYKLPPSLYRNPNTKRGRKAK